MVFRFADYRVDVAARGLERRNVPVPLQARPFALLVNLIRERSRVVPGGEQQMQVWRDAPVSYAASARAMTKRRQAFGTPGENATGNASLTRLELGLMALAAWDLGRHPVRVPNSLADHPIVPELRKRLRMPCVSFLARTPRLPTRL